MKAALITLGCPKNTVDSERMIFELMSSGYDMVSAEDAEVIILNTCAFLEEARKESIDTFFELSQYKNGNLKYLGIAGCLVSPSWMEDLKNELSEAALLIPVGKHGHIAEYLAPFTGIKPARMNRVYTQSSDGPYAYLKIAEGCSNCCSYCLIPSIRGPQQSFKEKDLLMQADRFKEQGIQELIVIAQDLTQWRGDGDTDLLNFMEKLSKKEFPWVRMLYLNPFNLNRDFFRRMKDIPGVIPYIDMPLQHIDTEVLARMNRNVTEKRICTLIEEARDEIPDICLRTTFIVGFPGETKKAHEKMFRFVEQTRFDRCGFFPYSPEPGTEAFNMDGKISHRTICQRFNALNALQEDITTEKNLSRIGKKTRVLIDYNDVENELGIPARSVREAPEIDGYIFIDTKSDLNGQVFADVVITDAFGADMTAEVADES